MVGESILLLVLSLNVLSSSSHNFCHDVTYRETEHIVKSPHYPQNYSNNLNCNYKIKLPQNTRIILKFSDIQLEKKDENGHCNDYLKIYDGLSSRSSEFEICGNGKNVVNEEIVSSSNKMKISFKSDASVSGKGFQFSYSSYQVCPDGISDLSRTSIKSPGYPKNYTRNLDCNYKIRLPKNTRIQLKFREVSLEKETEEGKCNDYIEVYDGFVTWAQLIQKQFCGNGKGVVNRPILSSSNKLRVRFVTNDAISNKGFELTYDPYEPRKVTDMTQKVTGVVIGTACGLVFLILTFLAICHSRHLTLLRRRDTRRYEIASTGGSDVIEGGGPPKYITVMTSPEKYPLTQRGQRKPKSSLETTHDSESGEGDPPPRYSGLFFTTPVVVSGQQDLEQNISRSMSTDV